VSLREAAIVIKRRDGISSEEAVALAKEGYEAAMEEMENGGDPEEVWMDITGLEPDYLL
jgi:hypothetical protein